MQKWADMVDIWVRVEGYNLGGETHPFLRSYS